MTLDDFKGELDPRNSMVKKKFPISRRGLSDYVFWEPWVLSAVRDL
jgi:hypothetical protein